MTLSVIDMCFNQHFKWSIIKTKEKKHIIDGISLDEGSDN